MNLILVFLEVQVYGRLIHMNLKKVLKYAAFSAIFLIPTVPLYVSGVLFFPFITGKAFLLYVP